MCNAHLDFLSHMELDQLLSTREEGHFRASFILICFGFFVINSDFLIIYSTTIGVTIAFCKSPNTRTFF